MIIASCEVDGDRPGKFSITLSGDVKIKWGHTFITLCDLTDDNIKEIVTDANRLLSLNHLARRGEPGKRNASKQKHNKIKQERTAK